MTWVKICGMTNLEDALVAVEAGADAVGFVFYPGSPRNVHPAVVEKIVAQLPNITEKVGVFVGDAAEIEAKKRIAHQAGLTAIQVYCSPSLRTLKELSLLRKKLFIAWSAEKVFSGRLGGFKWRSEAREKVSAIFLDSSTRKQRGGTGKAFDWAKAAKVVSAIDHGFRFVVAGGLTPANVGEAMQILKPWGVDVASGVESRPGKKDPEKVRAFVRAVREIDRKVS